jgi:excisionase family DNA binding protein
MSNFERDRDREFERAERARRAAVVSAPPAEFLPLSRVARLLGVCTRTLRRMIQAGRFPAPVSLGRRKLIAKSEYDHFATKLLQAREREQGRRV